MKYTIELRVVGLVKNVADARDDFLYLLNERDINHVCDSIGWDQLQKERPTVMWVEVLDGEYGDILCVFSSLPSSRYNTAYEVIRKYESVLGPDYDIPAIPERMKIINVDTSTRASLQDLLGLVDEARKELHELCQVNHNPVLAELYSDLTTVADNIYAVAYSKERE